MGDNSMHVVFIVLHFLSADLTDMCLQSLSGLDGGSADDNISMDIVVIDNGSHNGSIEIVQEKYRDDARIHFLFNEENVGFSKANNIAYRFAMENLRPDFVAVINNDVEILQKNFLHLLLDVFSKTQAYVIGPDIIAKRTLLHQSPIRLNLPTRQETIENIYLNSTGSSKRKIRSEVPLAKRLRWSVVKPLEQIPGVRVMLKRWREKRVESAQTRSLTPHKGALLQGAALIFTPLFVKTNELPFEPETFLYCEEDILAIRCATNQWKTWYDPCLQVFHYDDGATEALLGNNSKKSEFQRQNSVSAGNILLEYEDSIGW